MQCTGFMQMGVLPPHLLGLYAWCHDNMLLGRPQDQA